MISVMSEAGGKPTSKRGPRLPMGDYEITSKKCDHAVSCPVEPVAEWVFVSLGRAPVSNVFIPVRKGRHGPSDQAEYHWKDTGQNKDGSEENPCVHWYGIAQYAKVRNRSNVDPLAVCPVALLDYEYAEPQCHNGAQRSGNDQMFRGRHKGHSHEHG